MAGYATFDLDGAEVTYHKDVHLGEAWIVSPDNLQDEWSNVRVAFNHVAGSELQKRPDSIHEYVWNNLSPAMKKRMGTRRS